MGRKNESWQQTGTNSAGDPVYEKVVGGSAGEPAVSEEMTKAELQAEAEAQGLPTSGTKAELVERLAG